MKKILFSSIILLGSFVAFSQVKLAAYKSTGEKLNEEYCTGLFKTPDGTYFDLLNDINTASAQTYLNILDWLQGRVAGLQVYTTRNHAFIPFIRNSRAGIFVDEIYHDADFLDALPISDIAMIKVIKGPFPGGFNSPGGAIAIYTIRAEDEEEEGE